MTSMTKNDLLIQIANIIEEANEIKNSSEFPGLYKTSIHLLIKMKEAIETDDDLTKEELKTRSTSLGLFSVKEVDLYDKDFSTKLSKITHNFRNYYDLTDPHIKKRLAEMREKNKK